MTLSGYTSSELYHFVGWTDPENDERNYETLLKVLKSGRISHHPHDGPDGTVSYKLERAGPWLKEKFIVPAVTCYCDIPREHLSLHRAKYGNFGVGFDRSYLIKYGARPVIYIPVSTSDFGSPFGGSQMLHDIQAQYVGFLEQCVDPEEDHLPDKRSLARKPANVHEALAGITSVIEKSILAFIKPFNADLSDDNRSNYYLEREWRMYGNLPFRGQLKSVLVPGSFVDRAKHDVPEFAELVVPLA